ncbi:MAG: ParA family protein [Nitrospirae bacterium]|nr:ParA family protein [Nitrospirota bacterium]
MIIAIAHQKGGTGKSTVAINLACALNTDVLDLDSQASCKLFNLIRKKRGVSQLNCFTVDNTIELESVMVEYKTPSKMLVVDTGGFDSTLNRLVIVDANILITPVAPSQIELFGIQKFQSILEEASITVNKDIKTNVLINNADPRSKASILKLRQFIERNNKHLDLLYTVLSNRVDYRKAYEQGLSVMEFNKSSKASNEMLSLATEVANKINI